MHSSNMSQMNYIRTRLDDCDYHILILAGRYGLLDSGGIGFTEKNAIISVPLVWATVGTTEAFRDPRLSSTLLAMAGSTHRLANAPTLMGRNSSGSLASVTLRENERSKFVCQLSGTANPPDRSICRRHTSRASRSERAAPVEGFGGRVDDDIRQVPDPA